MQSKASTVDEWMGEVLEDRRAALERIRERCLNHLTGFEESIMYGGRVR